MGEETNRQLSTEAIQSESEKLRNQITDYTGKITELETQIRKAELEAGHENAFVERFSKHVNINELTRSIVDELIKSIHVYAPDRIEIIFNYADEFMRIHAD